MHAQWCPLGSCQWRTRHRLRVRRERVYKISRSDNERKECSENMAARQQRDSVLNNQCSVSDSERNLNHVQQVWVRERKIYIYNRLESTEIPVQQVWEGLRLNPWANQQCRAQLRRKECPGWGQPQPGRCSQMGSMRHDPGRPRRRNDRRALPGKCFINFILCVTLRTTGTPKEQAITLTWNFF